MVKLVLGAKGKGKTKFMLENVNAEAKQSEGLVIYIDKNSDHMFQLDKAIRLINAKEYPVSSLEGLMSFICGLIAGNGDIVSIYLDSFLILCEITQDEAAEAIRKMVVLSDKLGVDLTISASADESIVTDELKEHVTLAF